MDYITAAGAFNWPVPPGIDTIDIIAVSAGVTVTAGAATSGSSGAVSVRVGKAVTPAEVIQGSIGATVTVDGMTLTDANATWWAAASAGVGGDLNFPGILAATGGPSDIYSLTGNVVGPSIDGSPRLTGSFNSRTNYPGTFPGGGAYREGTGQQLGGAAAVFFIMFRSIG
ncbi:hypothetical protein [Azospirillum picis]|uniref:Tail fiber protein n=2 Tax=Azospirillum picis TaxID=488438 RepID=A0ABU0MRY9_9PROT|nr:hypothetical protein [Azospirillum picis]MBP2302512.1 hypothetical protein [Azospirillum picis]MDQ0536246.1 hypothetical protein [Azospirillum picis]